VVDVEVASPADDHPLGPASVVGIVGGGQLARMTAQAAVALDVEVRVLADESEPPAAVVSQVEIGSPRSASALASFAAGCDVVTFDHELVDLDAVAALEAAGHLVRPGSATIALAVDKSVQRRRLGQLGLPVPAWTEVAAPTHLDAFSGTHGWPLVLKAATGGYDGRGVWVVADRAEAVAVLDRATAQGVRLLAEPHLPIDRELAVVVARRPSGERVVYEPVETLQADGICREVRLPATVTGSVHDAARRIAAEIAEAIGAVGILAVELFVCGDAVIVNELACRPHNSGHITMDACITSQFENHLRAVLDLPLGSPSTVGPAAVMVNLLGSPAGDDPRHRLAGGLAFDRARVHLYGKGARPGRKVGHVNAVADDLAEARRIALSAADALTGMDNDVEAQ
jgi:5-(carboxyamino)imidazole ribonucleotide synthase